MLSVAGGVGRALFELLGVIGLWLFFSGGVGGRSVCVVECHESACDWT